MKLNLTKKLILFIEIIVGFVVVCGGLITFFIVQNSLQKQVYSQLQSITLLKKNSVNLYLKNGINEIEYLANKSSLIADYISNQTSVNKAELRTEFEDITNENKTLTGVSILNKGGEVLVSTNTEDEGKIYSNEDFFKKAQIQTTLQDYYFNVKTKEPAMFVASPILDSTGKFVGMVLGNISVKDINEIVTSRSGLGTTGETFIINSFNMVVTDLSKETDAAFRKTIYTPETKTCLSGKEVSTVTTDYHADSVVGYWSWFPELKSCVVTKIDSKEAFAPARNSALWFILVLLMLAVVVGIIGFIGGNSFIGPLKKLRDQIQKVKSGEFDVTVDINTKDEIGDMANVFNDMAKNLSKYKNTVETEVTDRTMQLNEKVNDLEQTKKAVINLLEDIEKQKKLSEQQAQELEKFKLVIENTTQHVIITDPDGVVIYANAAASKITGYDNAEIIGSKPSLWGRQMPLGFYEDMWKTISVDKKTFAGEIENKRKNGEVYIAKSIISPVLDEQRNVKFFVGLESDISKEKALELALVKEKESVDQKVIERTQELKEERARLLASINSIPFGFIIADGSNNIIMKNTAIMDIFKFNEDKNISFTDVVKFFGNTFNFEHKVEQCSRDKKVCELNDILVGSKIYRGIIAPIIVSEEDTSIGYIFLLEDITEAKVMERSKDEFFAVASHELRTPLTAIRGNSSMILDMYKDKIKSKDVTEMLVDINDASKRLIGIVNDFLDVSRLEQGKIEIKNTEFGISSTINKVIKSVKEGADTKNVELSYKKTKEVKVFTDEEKVEQILFNLIGNAIKFTSAGNVSIETKVAGNFVKISVTDTGSGISAKNEALLFRKFQPAGEQILARDVTKSTGLGLYISRLLISKLGGTIGLEKSEVGKGSTFFFTIPIIPLE